MNNKGFTLVELLAVVAIISILSIIAVPNVISIIDNNKKDVMLSDAQKLISKAKYEVNVDKNLRDNGGDIDFATLNDDKSISKSPDGDEYSISSFVRYSKTNGYCVHLENNKRIITDPDNGDCLKESDLLGRQVVKEK